jgi:hypothetical protein
MTRGVARSLFSTVLVLILTPSLVLAQATLAGVVRDTSGAVLPGVTVDATSPALIERTRSTVTDAGGQYQIVDLRPGTYALKFTLPGFSTVERSGVEVTGGGVISINAELRVGALQETVTVTGETPVVDVQTSTRRQQVLSSETMQALPASRGYGNYIAAVPGIQSTGFGSSAQPTTNFFTARGGRSSEGTIQIDGMNVGSSVGGGGVSGYLYDMATAAEVQVTIAGGLAEVDRGGPAFNMIPRTGGNTYSGTYFGSFAGEWAQSSNLDDELRSYGFSDLPALIKNWDTNFALGGPIARDRLWFFGNARTVGTHQDVPDLWGNANAGDPNAWTWVKDEGVKVRTANGKRITAMRLTWQATQRNKLGFYIDYTKNCTGSSYVQDGKGCRSRGDDWTASGPGIGPGVATTSPESGTIWDDRSKIIQASYSSPVSNQVLIEGGFSSFFTKWGDIRPDGVLTDFIPVTEQTTAAGTPRPNFIYRGWNPAASTDQQHATWRGSIAYVTGAHSLKAGYQAAYMLAKSTTMVGSQISYRFFNTVPNQLTQRVGPSMSSNRTRYNAFYVQDQWTRNRLTLQGGVRYEYAWSYFPGSENGIIEAHRFGDAFTFADTEGVRGYHDITPRMGAAYDVFGNGRTGLKVSVSKYLQSPFNGDAYTVNNPGVTFQQTTSRSWTDANGDRVADCDFMRPVANGECGAWTNLNWGNPVQTTEVNPAVLEGWGVRNWDWQFSVGVQQELLPRVSAEVSYARRWWGNFFITDNQALGPEDYDDVTLTAPTHPGLPGGGGYPVTFLARNTNSLLGASDPYYTTTSDFGDETHYWHGVDVSFNARLGNGVILQGGTSTGRGVNDTCEVQIARFGRPERLIGDERTPDCRFTERWLTTFRGLATYTVPKIDVMVSAILRSQPNSSPGGAVGSNGASRGADYQMNAAQFLAATGRALRPGVTSQTVDLLLPGQLYGDRVNGVDMRFSKILRFGAKRANIGLDLYNVFNMNTPTAYEELFDPGTSGANWMRPDSVLLPRFLRFNVQFDF